MKNTIRFSFEDLCTFFSRYADRLMVGMISTEGEAPEDVHEPRIVIKRDGAVVREYQGWSEVNGDICLEVYPEGKPLSRYQPQSPSDPRRPLGMLVNVQRDLHPNEQLQIDPMLCRARFYFRNGEIYSTNPYTNVRFEDFETREVCEHAPKDLTVKAGLDVEIPEEGYAVLRFFNGSEDFVFRSGSDYEVSVANVAEAITGEHSRFIYKIARSQPEHVWYCAGGESMGLPVAGTGGQAGCLIHEDDLAAWSWLIDLITGSQS